ncbi:MAG: hypothetical protein AAB726_02485, partial [Patescibacteria group bacterium]
MYQRKDSNAPSTDSLVACRALVRGIDRSGQTLKKIAILGNFTLTGLSECVIAKSYLQDIFVEVFAGAYNQWQQEILSKNLYSFGPDIIFLFLDFHGLDQDFFLNDRSKIATYRKSFEHNTIDMVLRYLSELGSRTKAKIVISTAVKTWPPPHDILESKLADGWYEIIDFYNQKLKDWCRNSGQFFVFDLDQWLSHVGKKWAWNDKYLFVADMRVSPLALPLWAEELVSYLIPLSGQKKKCIVVDLDNTLWGGVI